MTEKHTRRTVLKAGAAVGSVAVVGSLSGCSSLLGGGGTDYTNWLYEPGAIGDRDHYSFSVTNHQDYRDSEDALGDFYDTQEGREDRFPLSQMDIDYEEVNTTISARSGEVILGSFSESDVADELDDNDFDDEDYEGYTIWAKGGGDTGERQQVIALNGSTAVVSRGAFFGSGDTDAQDIVETLIDTDAGEEDRYVDESEDMSVLTDELGTGTSTSGSTQEETEETNVENGQFEAQVARGNRFDVDGETTTARSVLVFDSSDDIDTDDIEDWTDTENFDDFDDIEVSTSGRAAIVKAEADTEDVFSTDQSS